MQNRPELDVLSFGFLGERHREECEVQQIDCLSPKKFWLVRKIPVESWVLHSEDNILWLAQKRALNQLGYKEDQKLHSAFVKIQNSPLNNIFVVYFSAQQSCRLKFI